MAGECLNAQGGAMGMPQLCADWIPNQLFWLVVTLVVMFLVLSRVAIPRIGAVLAERKGTITNDLAAAEELKQKAKAAERAYEEALADARAEAARIIATTRTEIQKDLDAATRLALRVGEIPRPLGPRNGEGRAATRGRPTGAPCSGCLSQPGFP